VPATAIVVSRIITLSRNVWRLVLNIITSPVLRLGNRHADADISAQLVCDRNRMVIYLEPL
jgi:hypothetical protein